MAEGAARPCPPSVTPLLPPGIPCGPQPLPAVRGDSCFACNQTALMRATGVEEADLLFASLASRVALPAYAIIADHPCETVTIVVRGTLSLEDCVTDALADSASLEDVATELREGGDGWAAHAGILAAAHNVLQDIRERGVLERVLPHRKPSGGGSGAATGPSAPLNEALVPQRAPPPPSRPCLGLLRPHMRHAAVDRLSPLPGYRLRVCGHSLGGGTASILALLLRAEFPSLTCYAFGPPGGLVTPSLAAYMQSFVTTVVLGKVRPSGGGRGGERGVAAMRPPLQTPAVTSPVPRIAAAGSGVQAVLRLPRPPPQRGRGGAVLHVPPQVEASCTLPVVGGASVPCDATAAALTAPCVPTGARAAGAEPGGGVAPGAALCRGSPGPGGVPRARTGADARPPAGYPVPPRPRPPHSARASRPLPTAASH